MIGQIRRRALAAALILGAVAATPADAQRRLDLDNPEHALRAHRKITCSLVDGEPAVYWWEGRTYSRVPGERDRLLFRVAGMNIRACGTHTHPERGTGYRMVSREVLFYLDPETGEILRSWQNPWTGETVEVLHVANDPVNARVPTFVRGEDGTPYRFRGQLRDGWAWTSGEAPLWYVNPLAGDFQDEVGGMYQAIEMLNMYMPEAELRDARRNTVDNVMISWARMSQWLPWMKMGSRPGQLIFHTAGKRIANWDALPEFMKAEIRENYPAYTQAPPLDDARPNETSWTYFRKWHESRQRAQNPE